MQETYINYSQGRIIKRRNNSQHKTIELTSKQINSNPSEQFWNEVVDYIETNETQQTDKRYEKHNAWTQIIKNAGPYSHMFTLSFIHSYNDEQAIEAITRWCAYMNRNIFGPRWKKNGIGLSGVVVAERHVTSHAFRGRLHFHVLINRHTNGFSTCYLDEMASDCAMLLKNNSKYKMTAPERIDLREVENEGQLISYLLKDLDNKLLGGNGENIGFWKTGMEFSGFAFTAKTSAELKRIH